jgi:dTDP-4-dehydrorhamnose reductase
LKILVTGGTGLVGSNVIKRAVERGDEIVAALYRRRPAAPWVCATVPLDLEDEGSVRGAVAAVRPGAVIHCAAPRDEDRLEWDHAWGWRVMVDGTRWLAEACHEAGARLVFVSSDWVFGFGGEPPYAEDTPPCPANYFGFLKVVGETLVASLCPDSAVARAAGVYGINWAEPAYSPQEEPLGLGWLANYCAGRLAQGRTVAPWSDYVNVRGNPTLASDLADVLLELAAKSERGLFHCCGRDSVTRLELAQGVAAAFGFDPALVRAATPEEMDRRLLAGKLPAPYDSRLQCGQSQERLGRNLLGLPEGLSRFCRQLHAAGEEVRPIQARG